MKRIWLHRSAGLAWLVGWCVLLWAVAAPWRALGGWIDERLRWLEWFVLAFGLPCGFAVGRMARRALTSGRGRTHAHMLRFLLYPPLAATAAAVVLLTFLGQRGPIGVVVSACLSYWAGLDIAVGAVPMMQGRPFRFVRPIPQERRDDADETGGWLPPWEQF